MLGSTNDFAPEAGRKVTDVNQGDLWADTPFFAPGLTENTEFKLAWPIGQTLAGVLRGVREKKNAGPKSCKHYAILESTKGARFRVEAPGQLRHNLSELAAGTYVEITYKGKENVEGIGELHAFDVKKEVTQ